MQWAGHVARAEESATIKKAMVMEFEQPRPRGRPRKRWEDGVVLEDIGADNIVQWKQTAQDGNLWRSMVAEVKDPRGPLLRADHYP
ncbi:hypothetical protein WDU94_011118 [Cyamophila willieti]